MIANAVDQRAMLGDGTSNTPVGILNAGASVVPMTTVTWQHVLDFEGFIDQGNALDGTLGWAMNPHVKTTLRSTLVASATDSRMVMTDPNNLIGYMAITTSALPGSASNETPIAGTIIFGDWSELPIGSWTGVDILLNPPMRRLPTPKGGCSSAP